MRTIKFNIWVEDEKIMLRGIEQIREYAKRMSELWSEVMIPGYFSNLRHLQFTGLLDKNGKEIYEGDLVMYSGSNRVWEIYFDAEYLQYRMKSQDTKNALKSFIHYPFHELGTIEIIGNIHENPELLTNQ